MYSGKYAISVRCCHISKFNFLFKVVGNKKISTFYIKVFDLNRQNVVVWCYEKCSEHILNIAKIMTATSCAGKHMTSRSFFTLVLRFGLTDFQKLFPCSQYNN